jgi:hypothetical protein
MRSVFCEGTACVMSKLSTAFITTFGTTFGLAIALAAGQALAASVGAPGASAPSVRAAHSGSHPSVMRSPHRNGRHRGAFFPTTGGWYWGPSEPSNGEPNVGVTETVVGGPSYTCTLDIPWDWPHRCPPSLFASPPEPPPPPIIPYERGCPAQSVTVPGADGKDQTITIVRC